MKNSIHRKVSKKFHLLKFKIKPINHLQQRFMVMYDDAYHDKTFLIKIVQDTVSVMSNSIDWKF